MLGNLIDGGVGDGNPVAATIEALEYIGASEGFTAGNVIYLSLGMSFSFHNLEDGAGRVPGCMIGCAT